MKETMVKNALAVTKMLQEIARVYDLPEEEMFEMAMEVYKENMKYEEEE